MSNHSSGKVSENTRARLANGLLLALHSEQKLKATTVKDNVVEGTITDSEESSGGAMLYGEDFAGVPIKFSVTQVEGDVKSIRLLRGKAEVGYGEVSKIELF